MSLKWAVFCYILAWLWESILCACLCPSGSYSNVQVCCALLQVVLLWLRMKQRLSRPVQPDGHMSAGESSVCEKEAAHSFSIITSQHLKSKWPAVDEGVPRVGCCACVSHFGVSTETNVLTFFVSPSRRVLGGDWPPPTAPLPWSLWWWPDQLQMGMISSSGWTRGADCTPRRLLPSGLAGLMPWNFHRGRHTLHAFGMTFWHPLVGFSSNALCVNQIKWPPSQHKPVSVTDSSINKIKSSYPPCSQSLWLYSIW